MDKETQIRNNAYIIDEGENLRKIAENVKRVKSLSWDVETVMCCLMDKNQLSSPDRIQKGSKLWIPNEWKVSKDNRYMREKREKEIRDGRIIVRHGETLSEIAQTVKQQKGRSETVNVVMHCIMGKNGLSSPDRIRSGESLYLPDQYIPPKDHSYVKEDKMKEMRSGRYVVRPGDTLSEIAVLVKQLKHLSETVNVVMHCLMGKNRLSSPDRIRSRDSLYIPDQFLPPKDIEYVKEDKKKEMESGYYVVRPGDTLHEVAVLLKAKKNWSEPVMLVIYEIAIKNGVRDIDRVTAGTKLTMPSSIPKIATTINADNYTMVDFFRHASDPNVRYVGLTVSVERFLKAYPEMNNLKLSKFSQLKKKVLEMVENKKTSDELDYDSGVNSRTSSGLHIFEGIEYKFFLYNIKNPFLDRLGDWIIGNVGTIIHLHIDLTNNFQDYKVTGNIRFKTDTFDFNPKKDDANNYGQELLNTITKKYNGDIKPVSYKITITGKIPVYFEGKVSEDFKTP